MKPGTRALGIAESYDGSERKGYSTLAAVVVRRDRVVDGVAFDRSTVGGTDATDAVCRLVERIGREDVRYVFLAGIALSWYNICDLRTVSARVDRPVISVSFEASEGLTPALEREFAGASLTERLRTYRAQPERTPVTVNGQTVYVRAVGDIDEDETRQVVCEFTPTGGRPEPLRVARLVARAGHEYSRT